MGASFRIGIDLGGTKIEAAALDGAGNIRLRRRIATPTGDYDATVAARRVAAVVQVILTWRPELRVMALTRLDSGLAIANLHVSTSPPAAERELLDGAARALEFAGGDPLIFGGDFNVRPKASGVFAQLEDRFGLAPATAPDRLSHLLVHGLQVVEHPAALPPDARDVPDEATGFHIRLNEIAGGGTRADSLHVNEIIGWTAYTV